MALPKTNIRSFRFSDELLELINSQVGDTFSEKLERLIYNSYMLSGEKEKEIARLDELIVQRKTRLRDLDAELRSMQPFVISVKSQILSLNTYLRDFIEGEL
ncbi:MAG: hypothetical protein IKV68_06270 [Oscillospiraceae bacterium]|nr:hypothetical protein [Oscillospiraceae bacterium]